MLGCQKDNSLGTVSKQSGHFRVDKAFLSTDFLLISLDMIVQRLFFEVF